MKILKLQSVQNKIAKIFTASNRREAPDRRAYSEQYTRLKQREKRAMCKKNGTMQHCIPVAVARSPSTPLPSTNCRVLGVVFLYSYLEQTGVHFHTIEIICKLLITPASNYCLCIFNFKYILQTHICNIATFKRKTMKRYIK